MIDTIGFDDPTKNDDAEIIAELVSKMKNDCDHVNLFVIAVNGQAPRLDGSLITMIRIFEGMFSQEFWNQVVVVFTRVPMDKKNKKKRETVNKRKDDQLAEDYIKVVEDQFDDCRGLKYLYMDATYDKEDDEENIAFQNALSELRKYLENSPQLSTNYVQEVETNNAMLKRKIKEEEQARANAERELKDEINKLMKEKNLSEAEWHERFQALRDAHEAKGLPSRGILTKILDVVTLPVDLIRKGASFIDDLIGFKF